MLGVFFKVWYQDGAPWSQDGLHDLKIMGLKLFFLHLLLMEWIVGELVDMVNIPLYYQDSWHPRFFHQQYVWYHSNRANPMSKPRLMEKLPLRTPFVWRWPRLILQGETTYPPPCSSFFFFSVWDPKKTMSLKSIKWLLGGWTFQEEKTFQVDVFPHSKWYNSWPFWDGEFMRPFEQRLVR